MKESAGNMATPAPSFAEWPALCVRKVNESGVVANVDECRVVEFVPAYEMSGLTNRTVRQKCGLTITELQFALGETG